MAKNLALSLACGDYEILRPLKEGTAEADGIDLTMVTRLDASTRNWRFLRKGEFDVAELSLSSYLMARDTGMPIDAIPVYPHRRFRHAFVAINTSKGIRQPKDLVGRKVGVKSFQVSGILWLRGILEHEYGVPHRSIDWYTELDEDIEFTPSPGLRLTRLAHEQSVSEMLVRGELDAVLSPDLIPPIVEKHPSVARLFPDYKREELAYYRKTGIFPIMHLVALRREITQRHPWVAVELFQAFEAAKAIGMKRMENPRIAPLAWYREAWEEQIEVLGPDPWAYGLTEQNRKTLATAVQYAHEHGLIRRPIPIDELFLDVSEGRKRGKFII